MASKICIASTIVVLSLILIFSAYTISKHHQRVISSPPLSPPWAGPQTQSPPRPEPLAQPPQAGHPPSSHRFSSVSIHQACNITRYPKACENSLNGPDLVSSTDDPIGIVRFATTIAFKNLKTAQSTIQSLLDTSLDNQNRSKVAKTCLEVLRNAEYRISSTNESLPCGNIKDARAWMSAALVYEYGCWSGLRTVNDTKPVVDMVSFMNSLIEMTSNALNMMVAYDVFGKEVGSWKQPMTERDGFWEGVSGSGEKSGWEFKGGFPTGLMANVTVCKGGREGCKYKTVQEAVDAAPDNDNEHLFVIRIREGVYEETVRVALEKKNVVFLGDGMGKTVITGSLNVGQPGMTTYNTATVGVLGDGFMASGLTIKNTAGSAAHQAVAFRSDSDLSIIENCEFIGNQDTLYANTLRQFYKSCRIQGNVDFIFGNSASVFQDCLVLISPQASPNNNVITAHGRIDPAQSTGFIFQNCRVTGNKEYLELYNKNPKMHSNFLGRPWKEYSRTVFINCELGNLITPQGWMPWSDNFALHTLYYGEFKNTGPGANLSSRVPWSSQIPAEHVHAYSVQNFLQGDEWIPTPKTS